MVCQNNAINCFSNLCKSIEGHKLLIEATEEIKKPTTTSIKRLIIREKFDVANTYMSKFPMLFQCKALVDYNQFKNSNNIHEINISDFKHWHKNCDIQHKCKTPQKGLL